jgi:hypothetical protein
MMQQGILTFKDTTVFFRATQGSRGTFQLSPGAQFEIHLGGVWIPGRIVPEDEEGQLRFLTADGTFCGLIPGMQVRFVS